MNDKGNIRNLRFHYTTNSDRHIWTKGVYPYARHFLNLIRNIPWHDYKSTMSSYVTQSDMNNNNMYHPDKDDKFTYIEKEGYSIQYKYPYKLFGGSACEVLNAIYPKAANLHATTDPTGDIDVRIKCPIFQLKEKLKDDYSYSIYRTDIDKISPIAEHYINWLFDRIVERLPEVTKYFKNNSSFTLPLKEETNETSYGFRFHEEGPLLLTLLLSENKSMIKIQITTKYKDITDHVVEFVMTTEDVEPKDDSERHIMCLNNLCIESPLEQLGSQINGLMDRQEIDNSIKYKLINHYGRVMYLVKAIRWLADNNIITKNDTYWGKFGSLLKAIKTGVFEKEGICPLPANCSLINIVQPIYPFIKNAPRWEPILLKLGMQGGTRKKYNKTKKNKKNIRRPKTITRKKK